MKCSGAGKFGVGLGFCFIAFVNKQGRWYLGDFEERVIIVTASFYETCISVKCGFFSVVSRKMILF